jgi:glycosyltransferase involved in cell wall biosynthesis
VKICFYTSTALPKRGGQEIVVDELARALLALGHQVSVLAPKPRRPLKVSDENFPYAVARHPRFYSTRRFVDLYRVFLRHHFERQRFDILHCHGIYPPAYIAALCRRAVPVPLVVTNHEGALGEQNVRLAKTLIRRRYQQSLAAADAWVAVSQSIEEQYRRLCPAARPIVRIPNGIEVERWREPRPRPASLHDSIRPGHYVFFLGRLRRRKGADLLLRAFVQMGADKTCSLVIAGAGDEAAALKAQAGALGLGDKCRFVGWVDGDSKSYLLQNALLTVIPSRLEEAFGLVALESYAAGRPVLASSVAGLKELVVDGETGMCFDPDDPAALVRGLKIMLGDAQRLEQMGEQARRWVSAYDWQNIARRHVDLYGSLLQEPRCDSPDGQAKAEA